MRLPFIQSLRSERGNAIVEFAICVPVFLTLVLAAVDFSRLFFETTIASNAAAAGSFYGAQDVRYSTDYSGMSAVAAQDSTEVDGTTISADRYCDCPDGTIIDPCTTSCVGYGPPRVYMRARVQKNFTTLGWYPGIPETTVIDMRRWIRVQ